MKSGPKQGPAKPVVVGTQVPLQQQGISRDEIFAMRSQFFQQAGPGSTMIHNDEQGPGRQEMPQISGHGTANGSTTDKRVHGTI